MIRALGIGCCIILITWLGWSVFPGHTYLQSDTQIYLPILERLDTPGFLSRDLVAIHPHVSFTIYDEVALFFHKVGRLSFKEVLLGQQLLFRVASVLGAVWLAEAAGLALLPSVFAAAMFNLGAALLGPAVLLVEYEPVPRAFAVGLCVLALAFLARRQPLLGGLMGALAFLYHPPTAIPFWTLTTCMLVFDRALRRHVRAAFTPLLLAVLLLANLSQLQPGITEGPSLFSRLSPVLADLQHYRTRYVWVSAWAGHDLWNYLALATAGVWATVRIWVKLNRVLRWSFLFLPAFGLVSVPLSYLLLEKLHWAITPELQPARWLLSITIVTSLACSVAAFQAAERKRLAESFAWFLIPFALPATVRILDLLDFTNRGSLVRLAFCLCLSLAAAALACHMHAARQQLALCLLPVAAAFFYPGWGHVQNYPVIDTKPTEDLAHWAVESTWGSSLFLFPDAGHALYPGIFRAESKRALWVDWKSGGQVNYFESLALAWWQRWHQTMNGVYSPKRLNTFLDLPIDYYVVERRHPLPQVPAIYLNSQFAVYDARDLRNASTSVRSGMED